jgi:hypothetical protein
VRGVSDEDNVREPYRALTEREREILELLLTVEFEGIEGLRRQVPHARGARWNCGCASFNLKVDQTKALRSTVTKSPLSEASSRDRVAPRYYELLLWITDGWLSGVEIVDYVEQHGEQSPKEIPPLDHWDAPRLVHVPTPPTA